MPEGLRTPDRRPARPLRSLSAAALALGALGLASAFCGAGPSLFEVPEVDGGVVMHTRSRMWQGGRPNKQMIKARKMQMPSLNNLKDQYFIIYCRSPSIKQWCPMNIVSGSEALKSLKGATDNQIAKTIGADKFAEGQIVKAVGMNLYKQRDEITEQAKKMHKGLRYTENLQFGYKEIMNNTIFNDNPGQFLDMTGIVLIPPEEELRNLLDAAGETLGEAGEQISKVGDNVKGFFGGAGR